MSLETLIIWLVVGAVAGWTAGAIVKGGGFGLIGDIVVGIIGAFVGGWLAGALGIHIGNGILAAIVTATAGAVVLLLVVRLVRRG
ncbi:GlsB/YeaQ/YmgE family stress response membrane protein [Asticcacaulis sp. AC402]|uniref:GlsB/YeaQ/YmgE family stress response membrane protein n=1 Tax=Asticcacaulis sp. AC402 TaxID=1282361 RepID=UPI0004118CCC|nr:GlsB/YeaQ/YmgE family stress response membrane protein [Asticcacaulis sp. AC402]